MRRRLPKMTDKRQLVGINNTMPGPGSGAGRGYIIVGKLEEWVSPPVTLSLDGNDHAVAKETYGYKVRGLELGSGSLSCVVHGVGSAWGRVLTFGEVAMARLAARVTTTKYADERRDLGHGWRPPCHRPGCRRPRGNRVRPC
jgi:hypothetical protein